MSSINEDRARQVVPVWRSFSKTTGRGELSSAGAPIESHFDDSMVASLRKEWEETPILPIAADLVSAALTLGRFDAAREAAQSIITDASATSCAKEVAELYLERGNLPKGKELSFGAGSTEDLTHGRFEQSIRTQLQEDVRKSRKQLIEYPRNPVAWTNLALLYTSLGVFTKAERAIRTALALAPTNRFILRAASRFYLHIGRKHLAHRVLADAPNVRVDPWLLSSEIATAAAIGKTSLNIKIARRKLDLRRHTPFHLSELASAIGTLESHNGNLRNARPLVTFSLQSPVENSIAQAAWLYRTFGKIGAESGSTHSSEANAWYAFREQKWEACMKQTALWLVEQPFSSRPALLGAHIASVVRADYEAAASIAEQGLLSNWDDFSLRNSLAFSLAQNDDASRAAAVYKSVDLGSLTDQERIVWLATSGLIEFRSGRHEEGRNLYKLAMELGRQTRDVREIIALLYYAFEELRVEGPNAEEIRNRALESAKSLNIATYVQVIDRLKKLGRSS